MRYDPLSRSVILLTNINPIGGPMQLSSLSAISPVDGRYSAKFNELRPIFSEYGLIYYRLMVEIKWLLALGNSNIAGIPQLNPQQGHYLQSLIDNFCPECAAAVKTIEKTTNHDVKAIEYFIRDRLSAEKGLTPWLSYIHFACTSEDINNLAYALMLKTARSEVLLPTLSAISTDISAKSKQYSGLAMLSRTHGQTATPTTLGKEFANVLARIDRQIRQFESLEIMGKFNGATGNYNAHKAAFADVNWPEFNAEFIKSLGLTVNPLTTQIEPHDYIAEYLQNLTRINTILLDLARDLWSYISIGYFEQKANPNEVGSSTMPHKVNPIDFENAEGNLGIANALNEHLALKLPVSRWQRDLSDSTVLRNLGSAIAYSMLAYQSLQKGLNKISANQQIISEDLQDRWEVLAEPIQTVMRRYGIEDAYEQLKALTRGKQMTAELIRKFIEQSANLPADAKKALLELTPAHYIGYAAFLSQKLL